MSVILQGIRVWDTGEIIDCVIPEVASHIVCETGSIPINNNAQTDTIIDATGLTLAPGFEDPHVHFRDPGQTDKETMRSGAEAAAFGGYTHVLIMPNTVPALDGISTINSQGTPAQHPQQSNSVPALDSEPDAIAYLRAYERHHGALPVRYSICASATIGRAGFDYNPCSNWHTYVPHDAVDQQCAITHPVIAISDDGAAIPDHVLEHTLHDAKHTGAIVVDHCEHHDSGVMHEGATARALGVPGIAASTEYAIVTRDIQAAASTGIPIHLQHISTAAAVQAIREAKAHGVPVTCETAPHYIALCDEDVAALGAYAKMNPPLRSADDRQAIIAGLVDGTIDMIATDHAPHTQHEKEQGLLDAPNGIIGLETAFAVCYKALVEPGWIDEQRLIALMSVQPAALMGHHSSDIAGLLNTSAPCATRRTLDLRTVEHPDLVDLVVLDTQTPWTINAQQFHSKARNTPFHGWQVHARAVATIIGSQLVSSRLRNIANTTVNTVQ